MTDADFAQFDDDAVAQHNAQMERVERAEAEVARLTAILANCSGLDVHPRQQAQQHPAEKNGQSVSCDPHGHPPLSVCEQAFCRVSDEESSMSLDPVRTAKDAGCLSAIAPVGNRNWAGEDSAIGALDLRPELPHVNVCLSDSRDDLASRQSAARLVPSNKHDAGNGGCENSESSEDGVEVDSHLATLSDQDSAGNADPATLSSSGGARDDS